MMDMMQIATLLVTSVFIVPGLLIGIVLCCGKGADLIAGYNTASTSEKERWDEKALCRGTGILLLVILGCIEMSVVGAVLNAMSLVWTGIILAFVSTACGLAYINQNKRFKRNPSK